MTHSPAPKPTPSAPKPPKRIPKRSAKKLAADQKAGRPCYSTVARGTKKIPSHNPERAARKSVKYKKGLAAYKRSETYKRVEQRAGGQCEHQTRYVNQYRDSCGYPATTVQFVRCHRDREIGDTLHHHHLTYARFGGDELPEDMVLLCKGHHEAAEAKARPQNRHRFRVAHVGGEA